MRRFVLLLLLTPLLSVVKGQTHNLTTCSGIAFSFSEASEPLGTTYTWSEPTGTGFTGGLSETTPRIRLTGTLHNTTDNFVTAIYTVTSSTANSYTLVVSVTPIPKVDDIPDQAEVCPIFFSTPQVPLSGPTPNTLYFWSYSGINNGLPTFGSHPSYVPPYTASNPTGSLIQPLISIVPTINGCQGIPKSFRMPVKPAPDIASNPNLNLCNGVIAGNINLTSNVSNALITWTNSNPSIGLSPTGTGSIAGFTPINTGFVPITAIIDVTGFSNGCYGLNEQFQITVNPIPQMLSVSDISICGGISPTVTFQAPFYSGTSFNWTNSNTSIGIPAAGSGQINSLTVNNFNAVPIVGIFNVTPRLNGCNGTPVTFNLEVRSTPQVSTVGNIIKCANSTVGPISFGGSFIPGTVYEWQHSNINIGLASMTGVGDVPAFTATSSFISSIVSNFTVRPFSNTCYGPAINFSIQVNPTPSILPVPDQSNCEFLNATAVNFVSNVAGTVFNWTNTNPAIGLAAAGSGNIGAFTYNNPTTADITGVITVTPVSNTCSGNPISYSYTAKAAPDMVQPLTQTRCNGTLTDQVIFTSNSTPGSVFNWTRTNIGVGTLPLSGTGNIDAFTAVNFSGSPLQTIITVTPFSNTCNGPSRSFAIIINPTPAVTVTPGSPLIVCSGLTATVSFSGSPVNNTQYNWTNDNNLIGIGFSGTGNIAAFTTTNLSPLPITANLVVTPVSNSCQGASVSFSICVKPTPTMNVVGNSTICSGVLSSPINFSGSIVPGTQYNWVHTNNNIGISSLTGTGSITSFTATNIFNTPISSQFTVTPFSNGCNGSSRSFAINVNPTPSITPLADRVVCSGVSVTLNFGGSTVANTTYSWTNDNTGIGVAASGSGSSIVFTATNISNIPIVARFTVTPVSNTCNGIPIVFSVTVNPTISLNAVADQVRCSGTLTNPINFSGSLVSNTIYSWTNSIPAIGLASTSGTGNIPAFTTTTPSNVPIVSYFTVIAMSNSCNSITRSFSIVVNPIPSVTPLSNVTYCNGTAANLIFSGSPVPGTIYQWTNSRADMGLAISGSSANTSFTATNISNVPITTLITVTPVSNSCFGTANTFSITVNPIPTVLSVTNRQTCNNSIVNSISLTGSAIAGTIYNWTRTSIPIGAIPTSGSGDIPAFTATNASNVPYTSQFTVTPFSNTCSGTPISFFITVSPLPTINTVSNLDLCGGVATGNITFSDFTIAGTQFEWINSNPFIGLPASGTGNINSFTTANNFLTPISANISVVPVTNSCYGVGTQFSVIIRPTPSVDQLNNQAVCRGTVIPSIVFTGSALSGTVYNWTNTNLGTGINALSGTASISSFTSTNLSNIPISSLVSVVPFTNGCSGIPMQFSIRINPIPSVASVADRVICGTQTILPINFVGTTANGNVIVPNTDFNWTNSNVDIGLPISGSGSIPAFSATNLNNIPITGIIIVTPVSNSCAGTPTSFSIQIQPSPTVLPVAMQELCTNLATQPIILTGSTIPNTVYSWTNSNPAVGLASLTGTGNIPSFTATNSSNGPLTTNITVIPFSNTCSGTPYTIVITVNPIPAVDPISSLEVCGNTLTGPIVFTGSPLAGTLYQWTNNNTNIGLPATGTGTITAFTISNFNNIPVAAQLVVTPLSNTCYGVSRSFSILVKPSPQVDPISDQALCTNILTTPILFSGSTVFGTEYRWTQTNTAIGLPALSGTGNIGSFSAANMSNIPITSMFMVRGYSNTCYGTPVTFSITVNPIPAVYTQPDIVVCGNQTTGPVIFSGSPLIGTIYNWTNTNTSIGLPASGSGNILAFTAANNFNTTITAAISVTPFSNTCYGLPIQFSITVKPTPSVNGVPDRVFCTQAISSPINFVGSTIPNSIYQWTHNNPAIGLGALNGSGTIPAFTCTNLSNTRISSQFIVTPFTNGCSGEPITFRITVDPIPRLDPVNDIIVCGSRLTDPIIFTGSPIAGTVFNWTNNNASIGLPTTGVGNIISFTPNNNSTIPITSQITVTPFSNTCSGSAVSFSILVKPTPVLNAVNPQVLCANNTTVPIIFSGSAVPNTIFNWTNSFAGIGLPPAGTGNIASFTATSSYSIPVTSIVTVIPFSNGCSGDPVSFSITVNPIPTVSTLPSQVVCANQIINTMNFTGSIMAGTVYEWTNDNTNIGLAASGIGDISAFSATNPSNLPITSLITVTPMSNTCRGIPFSLNITVKPSPIVSPVNDQTYCGGTLTQEIFFTGSPVINTVYNWVQSNSNIGLSAISGTNSIPVFNTSNSTNIPIQSIIQVTPFSNGCSGPSSTFKFLVNPAPSVQPINNIVVCGNETIPSIIFSGSIVPNTDYRWTNNNTAIGLPTSGIGNIAAFSAPNDFSTPITAQISVIPFSNNCNGIPINFSITIKPAPTVSAVPNQILCANTLTQPVIFNGSQIEGTQYQWSVNNNNIGIGATSGIGNIPAFTATTLSNIPVTARFTVTPVSNACSGSPEFFDLTVNPIPTVNSLPDLIQCGSLTTQPIVFQGSSVPGTIYEWTNNNVGIGIPTAGTGSIAPFTANNSANQPISALIVVRPFSNNCYGSSKQFNITIKPLPTVDTIVNQILCAGQTTAAVVFTGSPILNTQYNWAASNALTGIPALSGVAGIGPFTTINITNITVANTITVTPFSNGCSGTPRTFNYTVHPIPNVSPINDIIACGSKQLGPIIINGSAVAGTQYQWINNNSSIGIPASGTGSIAAFTPLNVSTVPASSIITVTPISNSCSGSSISFSIVVRPIPVMALNLPQVICNQNSTTAISFVSSLPNTNFTWTNSNPSLGLAATTGSGNIPAFTGTNATVLPQSTVLTVQPEAAGCIGVSQSITIAVNPTPILSSTVLPTGICNGTLFSYTATSATPGTSFIWQRSAHPSINGNTSSGGFTSNINEILNSTNSQPISVTYQILLTANGCTNSQTITVLLSPAASLSGPPPPATVCSGNIFSYVTQTTSPNTLITWRRDPIAGISNPSNTGVSTISEILYNTTLSPVTVMYEVTLTSGGCSRMQTVTTVVLPLPNINAVNLTTCSGVMIQYTPTNTVENTQLTWSMPLIIPAGSVTGATANTLYRSNFIQVLTSNSTQIATAIYSVQTRANNCNGNSFSLTVQVLPSPVFSDVTLTPVCSGSQISYLPVGSATDTRFSWNLPDQRPKNSLSGATPANNQVQFNQTLTALNTIRDTAIYSLQPVSGNCIGTSFSLTVIIKPVALVGNKLDTICSGERYSYLPDSIPAGTTFIWDIPQIFPLGAVAGTQGQTIPVSQFLQTPVNLTQQIAILRYSIIAISDNCASQPFQLQANITRPIPNISVQNRQTCSGVNVDLTPGNVPLGLSYRWDVPIRPFNSNITGMEGTLVDVPAIQQRLFNRTINRDTIDYIIYPYRDNCVGNPFTIVVTVLPLPKVSVSGNGAICQNINDTLQFNFTGNGPWQFRYNDNGFTGARGQITTNPYTLVLPPNNNGPNPRIIKVYQVQDSTCTNIEDTVVVSQRVDGLPVGRIISLHGNYICNGRLDTMTAVSADDIIGWQWYKNGSRIVRGIFDSLSSNEEGVYQVVFTNRAGCSDTAVAAHRLIEARSPNIKFRFDYSCINTPIRFFNQTDSLVTGPLTWNWDFGNGQTATTYNSQTSYQVPGTYHVIVSAKQQNCNAFPAVLLDSIIQIVSPIERVDLPSVSAYKNVNKPIAGRSIPGYKYNWSPSIGLRRTDSASTIFNYGINVKYGIRMTSPEGCITTDSLLVRVFNDKLVDIFVPKSFTPNGDGVNDIIYAYITGISEFRYLKIINRFGKQVFETRNVDRGWDGVYNGTPQPMSVFFWLAEGVAEDGTIVQRSGQFLLMR